MDRSKCDASKALRGGAAPRAKNRRRVMNLTCRIGFSQAAIRGGLLVKKVTTKTALALLGCALLMLFVAPARADVCSTAFPSVPGGGCGVTITITGTTGHLVATLAGSGTPYDGLEDQLVGITNNSNVNVGAIVLSGPAVVEPVFAFDGDGPCVVLGGTICGLPTGYEGPNNKFVGISPDSTTGKVLFTTPLAPGQTTWFALENTPTSIVAIGQNQTLVAFQTSTFPY